MQRYDDIKGPVAMLSKEEVHIVTIIFHPCHPSFAASTPWDLMVRMDVRAVRQG